MPPATTRTPAAASWSARAAIEVVTGWPAIDGVAPRKNVNSGDDSTGSPPPTSHRSPTWPNRGGRAASTLVVNVYDGPSTARAAARTTRQASVLTRVASSWGPRGGGGRVVVVVGAAAADPAVDVAVDDGGDGVAGAPGGAPWDEHAATRSRASGTRARRRAAKVRPG